MTQMTLIGIDTGTHTGVAVWSSTAGQFLAVETLPIHRAMRSVLEWREKTGGDLRVYFEDARLRKWFGRASVEKLQGAGSVKRDCTIWEDFLRDEGIDFRAVPPKNNVTKVSAAWFAKVTGWTGRCSEHARDAAMLVFLRRGTESGASAI